MSGQGSALTAIAAYAPRSLSAQAAEFVRLVVAAACPATGARAKAFLFAAAKLASFGESVGLALEAELLLHPTVIERLIVSSERTISPATRRTLRTNLRALARALEAHPSPLPVRLPRERAKPPYSEPDIAGYLALASSLSTEPRRMHASALICLGAGAGLIGAELRHLRGADVVARSGGLLVVVDGARARTVPVLERFQQPLFEAAAFASGRYLVGGRSGERRNLTDVLSAALCADRGLPRLETGRLRTTWLVSCAQLIGLPAFMQAAGVRCSQRLGDLAAELPETGERELVALLGGAG
jgi:hypothetical protein